jgi:hypothetical protein
MRQYLLILFAFCNCTFALSQDILVLRKNEEEVKCRIVAMNDSIFSYRLWQSTDTTVYSVKKYEVLSFLMDKHSRKTKAFTDKTVKINPDIDLLGEYKSGTIAPGYVITNNNDSLIGFITIKNAVMNQAEIQFTDNTGKMTVYTTKDAKAYGYAKLRYEKIETGYTKELINGIRTKDGSQFLHLAVEGPSKLYRFYTLKFKSSTMVSYDKNPPTYLGKLKRQFVVTNPAGRKIFTKGRTLRGTLNRIYYDYPKYLTKVPVERTEAKELPDIVEGFNYWYENSR